MEDAVIESVDDGVFTLRSWDRDYTWSEVGATWIDADNQPGESATIAFVEGNPLMPIFFSRGSKPGSRIVAEDEVATTWAQYRFSYLRTNCVTGQPAMGEPSSVISFPVLYRIWEGASYVYGGSGGGNPDVSDAWALNGVTEDYRWIDFSINTDGLLIQISGYSDTLNGDVKFDGEPEPEYPAALPQTLEQRSFDGSITWQWTPPSIDETYTWTGDEDPPGGGGGGGGGGF